MWSLSKRLLKLYPFADSIVPFDGRCFDLARCIKPHIVFRGWDQKIGSFKWDPEFNVKLILIDRLQTHSTTAIVQGVCDSPKASPVTPARPLDGGASRTSAEITTSMQQSCIAATKT